MHQMHPHTFALTMSSSNTNNALKNLKVKMNEFKSDVCE